ncbi:hypothetical protein [Enhygromyxa salina]|uniref:hypothetical protein n=1 Tax=Enhygromyxa salina TaxID=215803 RepID=UPI000D030F3B|nr:hypothetical protein [Enhygromyxa salina]
MSALAVASTLAAVSSFLVVCPRAEAAPIQANAAAIAAAGKPDRARDEATAKARKAALEQAISSVEIPTDPAAVAQVLARAEAWTAAYRVLEVTTGADHVEVSVEVEIDLPRLRKRIAVVAASQRPSGFRFGKLQVSGCTGIDEAALTGPLRAYGIVADGGDATLSLTIACKDRGAVANTHVRAAAVEITAKTTGAVELELGFTGRGFAEDIEVATGIALDRAVGELADELAVVARGELELRVEQPWPAARVASLERSLREAVIGVDAVELAGISADGTAILRVGGRIDAKQLGRALQDLSFPGFALVGLRVDGAHALRVRMQ